MVGDSLIDDDHGLVFRVVLPTDIAPFDEAHANCVEIAGRDDIDEGGFEVALTRLATFGVNAPATVATEGKVISETCRLNAGKSIDAMNKILPEDAAFGGVVAVGNVDAD